MAQADNEVSVTDFLRETQQWSKTEKKMSLVWWVPTEYWRAALKNNKDIPEETIKKLEKTFDNYTLILACDLKIEGGGLTPTDEEKIRKSITLIDKNNSKYYPLKESKVDDEAIEIVDKMKPIFAQMLGQIGQGLYFYFFKAADDNGNKIISATQPGEFTVTLLDSEFHWKLPLTVLLPPKYCPIDHEKMKGNWIYCPIHGDKLPN
jgi:hypothetical protein